MDERNNGDLYILAVMLNFREIDQPGPAFPLVDEQVVEDAEVPIHQKDTAIVRPY